MKRIVAFLLVFVMIAALCACGEGSSQPTTAVPTTAKPTTVAPTTATPTTAIPTTATPTTAAPTTAAPTTAAPTTAAPTTAAPITAAPTTAKPTTAKPTTVAPTTAAPTTALPTVKPGRTRITWMNYNTHFETTISVEDVVIEEAPEEKFTGSANITVMISPKVAARFENVELTFRLGCKDDACWDSQERYTVKFAEDGSASFTINRQTGVQDEINPTPKMHIVLIEVDGYVNGG